MKEISRVLLNHNTYISLPIDFLMQKALLLQQLMAHHQEWNTESAAKEQDEVSSQLVSVVD